MDEQLGAEFGPGVDTHQVQRLAEANQKAAETAAAYAADDGEAPDELVESAVDVQAEVLEDLNQEAPPTKKEH